MDMNHYKDFHIELTKSQSKFDYYFLGIVIGLLSLSIQTFDVNSTLKSTYLIISTWGFLLLSFILGFLKETLTLRFKKVDLQKEKNRELADKYLKFYQKYILLCYKYQVRCFFLAIIAYIIFKITNIYDLTTCIEVWIILIIILISLLASFIYHRAIDNINK